MPEAAYRIMTLLCALVSLLPIGTNLGRLHLLWMLTSGRGLSAKVGLAGLLGNAGVLKEGGGAGQASAGGPVTARQEVNRSVLVWR